MIDDVKDDYLETLAAEGLAKGTIRYRRLYLNQFVCFLKERDITEARQISRAVVFDYQRYLFGTSTSLSTGLNLAPLTVHSKLSVLCRFLSYLFDQNLLFLDLAASVTFPKRVLGLPQTILSESEIRLFLQLPDTATKKGIRDKAILELLYSSGIRRAELAGLDLYDFNAEAETVKVRGKGRKERIVPVGNVACFWIGKYVREVRRVKREEETALFLDMVKGSRMHVNTLKNLVDEYVQKSGLKKRVTPHTFRHTCATHLLKHGADIRHIQTLLGHASPETTQLYARVEISDLEDVFRQTHPRARL